MRLRCTLLLALIASSAASLYGQNGVRSPQGFSIGLAGGGSAFTDFQRSNFQAQRLSSSGVEQEEFSRRVSAHTAGSVAGFVAFWPAQSWGLRAYGAYTPSRFEELISRSAAEFTNEPPASPMAKLSITNYQGQALFRLPTIKGRVMPYGIVGGGAIRYAVAGNDTVPSGTFNEFSSGSQTKFAISAGVGAMLQMRRRGWGLNFELMDIVSRTPLYPGPVHNTSTVSFTIGLSLLLHQR